MKRKFVWLRKKQNSVLLSQLVNIAIYVVIFITFLQAFHDSLDPEMMEEVLKVLKMEGTDKTLHAKEIEKYYHEQIDKHQQCMKCKASSSR